MAFLFMIRKFFTFEALVGNLAGAGPDQEKWEHCNLCVCGKETTLLICSLNYCRQILLREGLLPNH